VEKGGGGRQGREKRKRVVVDWCNGGGRREMRKNISMLLQHLMYETEYEILN